VLYILAISPQNIVYTMTNSFYYLSLCAYLFTLPVKELVGEENVAQFEALTAEGGTITGAQLKERYAVHQASTVVSFHPYFEIAEGRKADFDELWKAILPTVQAEAGCLGYEFSFNGNIGYVRESYANAEAVFVHAANTAETMAKLLEFCKILNFDVVGSETELAKLREPLAALNPTFMVIDTGYRKSVVSSDPSVVTIQPYFGVPADRLEEFKGIWAPILPVVQATEEANQYYEFAFSAENVAFVREAYLGADGLLAHLGMLII
jgi:quinol monooxygenase YgiN